MEPAKIQFSHYQALKPIGRGAVGEVYLAEDTQAKRQVAAKVIRLEALQADREININTLRQFLREVGASAELKHPNILPIGENGEATFAGSPGVYVTMPYRSEGSLSTWLSQHAQKQPGWRPTPRQVIHIIRQVGAALQHAHEHKIKHLDLKPNNILLHNRSSIDEYPDLLLSDFGTAILLSAPLKNGQDTSATSAYLAPEQREHKAEAASDQYALAAIAYELLTGQPPFQGTSAQEPLKPACAFLPQLPAEADQALQRALTRNPAERFPSVMAFTQAFQTALQGLAAETKSANPPTPAPASPAPSAPKKGDIHATLNISEQEAREGTVRALNLPNGQKVEVQIPAGAQPEQMIVLSGKGDVPAPGSQAGDLYLRLSLPKIPAVVLAASAKGNPPSLAGVAPLTPPATLPNSQGAVGVTPLPPFPGSPQSNTPPQGVGPTPRFSTVAPPMGTPPQGTPLSAPPHSSTPPQGTPLSPIAQGPASIAPMPPQPPMAQGPASIAPMPPAPVTPRPNISQGPASIAPMPPSPVATPRPNMGPASMAPMPPTPPLSNTPPQGTVMPPRSSIAQGPASIAPMPPTPMAPRSPMAQGPASIAPMPPAQNAFERRAPGGFTSTPAPTQRRANSPAAVIIMMVLLILAVGISSVGVLRSNQALLSDILYGQTTPTASSAFHQATPTATPKPGPSLWHAQTSGTTQGLIAVTWADTRFVTVGDQGTVLTSPNGSIWTAQRSNTTQTLWSVVWSGTQLVAVGTDGTIISSPDGVTWTVQSSGTTQDLWSVNWIDGSVFVVAGSHGTILTSRDGHKWTSQSVNAGMILDGVAFSGSLLVVVGADGAIVTSADDGATWTVVDAITQQLLQSVSWVNNQFIAVGTNGTILTSAKGTSWTIQNSGVTQNLSAVGWNGAFDVVLGDHGLIMTSQKGITWSPQSSGTTQNLQSLARSTTTFATVVTTPIPTTPLLLAVGAHGTILVGP